VPSLGGNKYAYAAAQIAKNEALHPDAHMFLQHDFYQVEPDVITSIMTQLSLKAGLRKWGDKGYEAAYAEMKQLHLRNMFVRKYYHQLLCAL